MEEFELELSRDVPANSFGNQMSLDEIPKMLADLLQFKENWR
jgi:hypothetical protein